MNGDLGWFTLLPDQMQTLNAVLVLIFIPLFEYIIYPLLAKLRLVRTSLQKLIWGGFLAALAFVVSGALELRIQVIFMIYFFLLDIIYIPIFGNNKTAIIKTIS